MAEPRKLSDLDNAMMDIESPLIMAEGMAATLMFLTEETANALDPRVPEILACVSNALTDYLRRTRSQWETALDLHRKREEGARNA